MLCIVKKPLPETARVKIMRRHTCSGTTDKTLVSRPHVSTVKKAKASRKSSGSGTTERSKVSRPVVPTAKKTRRNISSASTEKTLVSRPPVSTVKKANVSRKRVSCGTTERSKVSRPAVSNVKKATPRASVDQKSSVSQEVSKPAVPVKHTVGRRRASLALTSLIPRLVKPPPAKDVLKWAPRFRLLRK